MPKPRLYAFATPNQLGMANAMRESAVEFDVVLIEGESSNPYLDKAKTIKAGLEAELERGSDIFFWADNDCIFLRPVVQDLTRRIQGVQAVFQQDGLGGLCAGYFAAKPTAKFIEFWDKVLGMKEHYVPGDIGDQAALNKLRGEICYDILPLDEYWTPCAMLRGGAQHGWSLPNGAINPDRIRMAHIACTFGPDKQRLLSEIKEAYMNGQGPMPTQESNPRGFHQRFNLSKVDGTPIDPEAVYFVLRLDGKGRDPKHIAACRKAALAYADAIESSLPVLASDLRKICNT